ncbi:CRISPR-associated endonuclease Cas2, partial [Spirulina sp. CS-785/01]
MFECLLDERKFEELRERLRHRYEEGEDSIRFYPLSRHTLGRVEVWGEPPVT